MSEPEPLADLQKALSDIRAARTTIERSHDASVRRLDGLLNDIAKVQVSSSKAIARAEELIRRLERADRPRPCSCWKHL